MSLWSWGTWRFSISWEPRISRWARGPGGPPPGGLGGLPPGGPHLEGCLPSSGDPSSPGSPSGDPPVLLLLDTSGLWQPGGSHPPGLLPDAESPSSSGELPSSPPGVCLGLV